MKLVTHSLRMGTGAHGWLSQLNIDFTVIISWFVSSSPKSGSALTVWCLPGSSVSLALSAPPPLMHAHSLSSKINIWGENGYNSNFITTPIVWDREKINFTVEKPEKHYLRWSKLTLTMTNHAGTTYVVKNQPPCLGTKIQCKDRVEDEENYSFSTLLWHSSDNPGCPKTGERKESECLTHRDHSHAG